MPVQGLMLQPISLAEPDHQMHLPCSHLRSSGEKLKASKRNFKEVVRLKNFSRQMLTAYTDSKPDFTNSGEIRDYN